MPGTSELTEASPALLPLDTQLRLWVSTGSKTLPPMLGVSYGTFATATSVGAGELRFGP